MAPTSRAAQIDIPGPPGSVAFGAAVAVLPNGNIVVTDPNAGADNQGAVYLYSPSGDQISSLVGSATNDHVGGRGITVLTNGNFVISSPSWNNGAAANAGAVTWANGILGISGSVSAANSLVGTTVDDEVGSSGITALPNGNYVVASPYWNAQVGAVTWANGATGLSGAVSVGNSLVGSSSNDQVGNVGVTGLINGNYVVASPSWTNGAASNAGSGAATWANGSTGLSGIVSASNSLIGTFANDGTGLRVTALSNGNYVVAYPNWKNAASAAVGAVIWANGATGLSGVVSATNSLVGSADYDFVGSHSVTALTNGNYVVVSDSWANGTATNAGAVTLANGSVGLSGVVSASNSLVGTAANDSVGIGGVIALSNGNYVVASPFWANGSATNAGAATWGNGDTGILGPVSLVNSLVGTRTNDWVATSVIALSNGNYVVASPDWASDDSTVMVGAATWADGSVGLSGLISVSNSLVGTTASDNVGVGVTALSNGNYVVTSHWSNGTITGVGAATWADGSAGLAGSVSPTNSLIGTTSYDVVGLGGVTALSNGNYVVASPNWSNGTATNAGAATWANGSIGLSGIVSASNSLVGILANDHVSSNRVSALSNGNYVVASYGWANGAVAGAGAVSLGYGSGGLIGPIHATNSVRGTIANGGQSMVFAYDATRNQLVVGQPSNNVVSLFNALVFANGFE